MCNAHCASYSYLDMGYLTAIKLPSINELIKLINRKIQKKIATENNYK